MQDRAQQGLTEKEAKRRLAERGPPPKQEASRSYASIVRANVFTLFNLILLVFGGLTLAFGAAQDALFLGVVVANSTIGIAQEVRAKRALDELAALVSPTATVVRGGRPRTAAVEEIVVDDLLRIGPGDEIVADGTIESASALRLDESILTGESDAVARSVGDEVRAGSFAVEGTGAYTVTAVGKESYAAKITGQAQAFRHPRSPLERAMNRLLLVLVGIMVPLGIMLVVALWRRHAPMSEAVPTSVAAAVTLIPEGLILLASVTYAVAAVRMADRGALAQQLNAIESLASVDLVCLDKTGTLTEPTLRLVDVVPSDGTPPGELRSILTRYAHAFETRNATLEAISDADPEARDRDGRAVVPFSSRWKWSAAALDDATYVLGAPERVGVGILADTAAHEAEEGRRVLAVGRTRADLASLDPASDPPPSVEPLGIVVLAEQLRPEARETVAFFTDQGVELKVISGDRPATVGAIAGDVGIEDGTVLDGSALPKNAGELRAAVSGARAIGRISPDDKRRVVEALRDGGRYVAMIGDGVNDVPALKAARLAIAQGTGTQMAKAVADLVLVRGTFAVVPPMVDEGRKVLRNLQRVTKLFVTKSMFATFLILSVGLTPLAYPLLPRHLTLAAALTIGIPSFFLALAPSSGSYRATGFLREVSRFAVPAGTSAGLGVLAGYLFAIDVAGFHLRPARTVATTVLVGVGLYLIIALEASPGTRRTAVSVLCGVLAAVYLAVLATPALRSFFALSSPGVAGLTIALGGIGVAIAGLVLTDDRFLPGRGGTPA